MGRGGCLFVLTFPALPGAILPYLLVSACYVFCHATFLSPFLYLTALFRATLPLSPLTPPFCLSFPALSDSSTPSRPRLLCLLSCYLFVLFLYLTALFRATKPPFLGRSCLCLLSRHLFVLLFPLSAIPLFLLGLACYVFCQATFLSSFST